MIRAMTSSITDYVCDAVAGWNRFWFTPTDPAVLSMIRIFAGAMLFYTHFVWSLDLTAFFGPDGWIPANVVEAAPEYHALAYWSHLWYIQSPALLWTAHLAALAVFFLLMIGYKSRVMAVLAYLLAVAYVHRAPAAFFGLDKVNCMLAMYLMLGPSGACYSLDRWLAGRKSDGPLPPTEPSIGANIAVRLIQLHMCIIYLFSGLDKLQGETWWNGTAVWLSVASLEYQSLDMTWLAHWPKLVALMTHITIFWEVFYIAMVWNRTLRPLVLLMAVVLHGGIVAFLGMPTFGLAMLIGNASFLSPAFVRGLFDPIARRLNKALEPDGA